MRPEELVSMGLDRRVADIVRSWGVEEFYPPQAEALPLALSGKNVVVSIPTASGKSLIAHLALVKKTMGGGKGLYIVPLKALAQEKYEELCSFKPLGIKVGMSIGDLDIIEEGFDNYDILVTTSEKADSILRHRERWGSSLSIIVADEVHLIHEDDRGPTLEVLLSRLRQLNPKVQIVALSATIRNAREIAMWLDSHLVESDWRPVDLREGAYFQHTILFPDGSTRHVPGELDHVPALAKQIIDEGGQCLVFVSTRRSAESAAKKLAETLGLSASKMKKRNLESEVDLEEDVGVHKKLRWCLERGTAFHHAGLDSQYRRIVETSFKDGSIKCICATPTLAAGINLPARRVIIRDLRRYDPNTGSSYLPVLFVKQACGRAGRPHLDPYGEAILMARSEAEAEKLLEIYVLGETEDIVSKLGRENVLRRHLLGLIASGACGSDEDIKKFFETTFYAYQRELWEMDEELEGAMDFLLSNGFVEETGGMLSPTLFGRRTSDLYIDPITAKNYRMALEHALTLEGKATELGFMHAVASSPDMLKLYITSKDLEIMEEYVSLHRDEFLLPVPEDDADYDQFLRELKTAMLLMDWIGEMDEDSISKKYAVGPGDIHNRVETARWLVHAMGAMASLFNPSAVGSVGRLGKRVNYGVKEELLDLVRIRNVGRKRARALWERGYKRGVDVQKAKPEELAKIPGFGPRMAEKITGKSVRAGGGTGDESWAGESAEEQTSGAGQQRLTDF